MNMPIQNQSGWLRACCAAAVLSLTIGAVQAAGPFDTAVQIEKQITRAAAESQERIDKLADQKLDLSSEYKATLQRIDSLKAYNAQVRELVKSQEAEKVSIKQEIESVDDTEKGLVPLMQQMIDTLEQFVALDVPFLPEEREKRIARLRTNMQRADISLSEKYRQILEAYQIEVDYGNSFESYQGSVAGDSGDLTVNFLRFGRIALIYSTLDGNKAFVWNHNDKSWESLSADYLSSVRTAIAMTRNQAPKDLVKLPVFAAESK